MAITHEQLIAAFAAKGITAYWDYPGVITATDAAGRHLVIGKANGPWGVDVFPNVQAAIDGTCPEASMDIIDEGDPALMVQQFLYIASEFVEID